MRASSHAGSQSQASACTASCRSTQGRQRAGGGPSLHIPSPLRRCCLPAQRLQLPSPPPHRRPAPVQLALQQPLPQLPAAPPRRRCVPAAAMALSTASAAAAASRRRPDARLPCGGLPQLEVGLKGGLHRRHTCSPCQPSCCCRRRRACRAAAAAAGWGGGGVDQPPAAFLGAAGQQAGPQTRALMGLAFYSPQSPQSLPGDQQNSQPAGRTAHRRAAPPEDLGRQLAPHAR